MPEPVLADDAAHDDSRDSPGNANTLTVSVRALCAFAARSGDLDLRFTPAPSAPEGAAGHRLVQSRRGSSYQAEVGLASQRGALRVRGRADGFDASLGRLEEIKTFRGKFEAIRANQRAIHWAQAKVYAAMLCERHGLDSIQVVLVYFDLETEAETAIEESHARPSLDLHLDVLCQSYLAWATQQKAHRQALDSAAGRLSFPHQAFRAGQHELARGIYQGAVSRRSLLAQAPTGIGKTLASLFPLLKAKSTRRIDKIFFLTAKTSGRTVALDAMRQLRTPNVQPRVIELAARESVCVHPDRACHGDSCPLARGFYDRLPAARIEAAAVGWLDRAQLRSTASAHDVCPYFLAQEMVRWSDVVIADYNYYFDASAFLYGMAIEEAWSIALLVDEAHNLLERARSMYSSEVGTPMLEAAKAGAPAGIRVALSQLQRHWRMPDANLADVPGQAESCDISEHVPEALGHAVQAAVAALGDHFAAHPNAATGPLQDCFFELLHFYRLSEAFGNHSVLVRSSALGSGTSLAIRNLIPASFLAPRFAAARSVACFSGTLSPFGFYRDTLGLPASTATLEVDSPFHADQLTVRLAVDLSTRYRDRDRSMTRLVDVIASQFRERPGNYLAFFGSFEYLAKAADAFATRHPDIPMRCQPRGMTSMQRDAFLDRFETHREGVGFAVLGGAFSEGIDLPGDRLIGAFVASLGLPTHDALNEAMCKRMDQRFGEGYAYTYLYPGLQKVVQAAGRVIRSESDRGVVYLLDDRFTQDEVLRLLPRWWRPENWTAARVRTRTAPEPN